MKPTQHPQLVKILFKKWNACVLVPTYNNSGTLSIVLNDILKYCEDVIVINDGSTDNTNSILIAYPQIKVVSYKNNRGKGYALRKGFRTAAETGYQYAITLDSDGQHYASDLHVFLKHLETWHEDKDDREARNREVLMIGSRNLEQENVPGKSSFGNKFSSFWFWVNTGIRLPDTQSGYRLYPLKRLHAWKYFTTKYEFEIEVIVRAAWAGIPVVHVPISVYYPPKEERISHFRPFKDFTRISLLNTILVLSAFFYFHPRRFLRQITTKDGLKKISQALFIHPHESNHTKALSLAFGAFMGIVPVWGFQLAIGIPLAIFFKLNKTLFILAANISIFPITAFWILASLALGKWMMGDNSWSNTFEQFSATQVAKDGAAFLLGGTLLSITMGVLVYFLSLLLLQLFRKPKASGAQPS